MAAGNLEVGGAEPVSTASEQAFQLGGWRIAPALNEISHDGESLRVEPKMMQTLVVLARNAGHAVTRDELMATVWGHTHITDDTLNRIVSRLRKILSNGGNGSVVIETLPKVGYRLVPPSGAQAPGLLSRPRHWLAAAALLGLLGVLLAVRDDADPQLPVVSTATATRTSPVTTLPGRETSPAFSPDGSQLAFAWSKPGSNTRQLYVRTVGSESLRQLTGGEFDDRMPAWSPDGRQIAFLRYGNDETCSINIVPATGGAARRVAACDSKADPVLAWLPDGSALIFSSPQDHLHKGMDILYLDSGRVEPLTRPPANELGDAQPAVSPDGKWLAFTRWHVFGVANIFLLPMNGDGELRQVTFDNLKVHGITWEPDGKHLVFSSNRGGDFGLWRVNISGDAPQRLPLPGRAMDSPAMSADGRYIAWEDWNNNSEILSVALDNSGQAEVLASSTRWDWSPRMSPDGSRMAFASDRSGASEIWVKELSAGLPMRLTGFGGPYTSNPEWSPDGRYIVFDTPADGDFDIWLVEAAGGVPQRMTNTPSQERFAVFSPDGERLYFGSNRTGSWEIWQRDLVSGMEKQMTRNGGYLAREHGEWLYFSKSTAAGGLWRIPVAGGEEELVSGSLQAYHCTNWLIHDAQIFFTTWDRATNQTWLNRMALDGSAETRLRQLPNFVYKSGVELTADGRAIFGSEVESHSDIIMSSLD